MNNAFAGKIFLLVTGASRGIGKQIAQAFASQLQDGSKILLLARNTNHLKKTIDEFPKDLIAAYESVDFGQTSTDKLQDILTKSLNGEKPESYDQAIIVHSAAMANFTQLTTEMTDSDEWHQCFTINMFSPAVLNGVFMKTFNAQTIKKHVINVTSYWSQNPDPYVGSYCSAAAAKAMYFKVFALENPEINVLNYLPGFVETDMFYDVLNHSKNEELKSKIRDMIEHKSYVTPLETSEYLIKVLKERNYESGGFVDYYNKT